MGGYAQYRSRVTVDVVMYGDNPLDAMAKTLSILEKNGMTEVVSVDVEESWIKNNGT